LSWPLALFRSVAAPHENERIELEMKIRKASQLAGQVDETTRERIEGLVQDLERRLRNMDD
jgi:hypothetical protein